MKILRNIVPGILIFLLGACTQADFNANASSLRDGENCTQEFIMGLNIKITVPTDEFGVMITDGLTVDVVDMETGTAERLNTVNNRTINNLRYDDDTSEVIFSAAGERPGYYTITATLPEHASAQVSEVEVGSTDCHVLPKTISLDLRVDNPFL